ncbi:CDP-alcohol phosphatidyltransferase family protein [Hippea sp. KM1]|uniref:CDP-alcohol phosphatidyltransferase family protein n=1 Tax=Hippea sp. KM1 TaxID=944481 RepID=UPI00046D7B95|nr:CDP-alcohol phosphatidyltransferase family protein [Hippea sp. KM1]
MPINTANAITIFRIILVLPITLLLIEGLFGWAVWLFGVAAASDIIDGFIARRFNQATKLGAILDPLADKLLLNYTFLVLSIKGLIPLFLLSVVLFKDLTLITGSVIEVLSAKSIKNLKIKASIWGKVSTFFQVVVVVLVFLDLFGIYRNHAVFRISVFITAFLVIIALFDYINKYRNRIKEGLV